jgi:hypothetical protein
MSDELRQVEQDLLATWIRPILADGEVQFGPPAPSIEHAPQARTGVTLQLLDLLPGSPMRGPAAPSLQLIARYSVRCTSEDPATARVLLAELAFAALTLPMLELERNPRPPDPAHGPGEVPSPAITIRVTVPRARVSTPKPLVRRPLELTPSPLAPLTGMVVAGQDDVPVSGARVEIAGQTLVAYADHRGEFRFPAVAAVPKTKTLLVHAKGQDVRVDTEHAADQTDRLVIRLSLPEE